MADSCDPAPPAQPVGNKSGRTVFCAKFQKDLPGLDKSPYWNINTTYFNDTSTAFPPILEVRRGTGWDAQREVIETAASNGFLAEAESFHDLVRHGWDQWVGATPDESIDIALTLDALADSARTGTPADVRART
jgi:hypothetical protein